MAKAKKTEPAEGAEGFYIQKDGKGRIIAASSLEQRGAPIISDVEKTVQVERKNEETGEIEVVDETITVQEITGYESGPDQEFIEGPMPELYSPFTLDMALAERDQRLAESDWVVIRALERGQTVPAEWRAYRDALREVDETTDLDALKWPDKP